MARSSLPPGFRFHPTNVELVMYYLKRKILGKKFHFEAISEVNIYKFSPWDLPDKSCLRSKDREWFFFCPIERKYPNGGRTKRATETGHWKITGKDRNVLYKEKSVGKVRTLVFHTGQAPKGNRTNWVMHEYKLEDRDMADTGIQDSYVLCKVFEKSGPGPKNGAQYGAPFNEEDWSEDEETHGESSHVDGLAPPMLPLPNFQNSSYATSMIDPGGASSWSLSEPGPSTAGPSVTEVPEGDVDIASMLDMFFEDGTLLPTMDDNNQKLKHTNCDENMEENNIFHGLDDLNDGGYNYSCIDKAFLELNDLDTPLVHPVDEANGSELLSADASSVSYNHQINLDHLYHGSTFSGSIQNYSGLNQSLDQSNYPGNHFHVLQKDIGSRDDANEGDITTLYDMDFTRSQSNGSKDAAS